MIEIKKLSYYRNNLCNNLNDDTHGINYESTNCILSDINLTLSEHRIAIIGANGSGKSSLTKMFNGLLTPGQGDVLVNKVSAKNQPRQVRKLVGYIFQNAEHQLIFPTVEEDLAFGLKNLKLPAEEINSKINDLLSYYQMSKFQKRNIDNLSGGEKQLIAILGVIIMNPEILIFDEPTTLLDLRNKNKLMKLISNLSQQVILVTHDLDLILDFDRVIVMESGRVSFDGHPTDAVCHYRGLME